MKIGLKFQSVEQNISCSLNYKIKSPTFMILKMFQAYSMVLGKKGNLYYSDCYKLKNTLCKTLWNTVQKCMILNLKCFHCFINEKEKKTFFLQCASLNKNCTLCQRTTINNFGVYNIVLIFIYCVFSNAQGPFDFDADPDPGSVPQKINLDPSHY